MEFRKNKSFPYLGVEPGGNLSVTIRGFCNACQFENQFLIRPTCSRDCRQGGTSGEPSGRLGCIFSATVCGNFVFVIIIIIIIIVIIIIIIIRRRDRTQTLFFLVSSSRLAAALSFP
jgi:hypothetical protein